MQLIKNGPDIPLEVLQKLEDEELIFFCGAGISLKAGLPKFDELVTWVYEELKEEKNQREEYAFKEKQYDRVLGLLETRLNDPSLVKKEVIKILEIRAPNSEALSTHEALLTLSTKKDGFCRLVTTNVDRGFVISNPDLKVDYAPKLPVPKEYRWNSLVHLHGLIRDEDPDGEDLVLTSADFGTAYLTERWASRFVTELFNRYSVIFVGYSINDPVLRYMMDALASDRNQGDKQAQKAYAFASSEAGKESKAKEEWKAKGVEPIIYDEIKDHVLLHDTLKKWADLHRDGLVGMEQLVQAHGQRIPLKPYKEDETVGQLCWALKESSGHITRLFSALDPTPPIEWLEVFDQQGLLNMPNSAKVHTPLCGPSRITCTPLDLSNSTRALGFWLARHLDKKDVLHWVIKRGGYLHPEMRRIVRSRLNNEPPLKTFNIVWDFLSSESYACSCSNHADWYDLLRKLKNNPWSPYLKQQLLFLLSPFIKFKLSMWTPHEATTEEVDSNKADIDVRHLVDAEIMLNEHVVHSIPNDLMKLTNCQQILSDIAEGVTECLLKAWDMLAEFRMVKWDCDFSYIHQPSITDHEQNNYYEDWTKLVVLVRDSWKAVLESSPNRARALIERWQSIRYPIFRRLALFGMAESQLYSVEESLSYLVEDDQWWLWSVETQRETYRLLKTIVPRLNVTTSAQLSRAILDGPPRNMFQTTIPETEYQHLVDRKTWVILVKLMEYGWELPQNCKERFDRIVQAHPEWKLRKGDQDEFPSWSESYCGPPSPYLADQLLAKSDEELHQIFMDTRDNREGLLDEWQKASRQNHERVIKYLLFAANKDSWQDDVWSHALSGFEGDETFVDSWQQLAPVLLRAPKDFIHKALFPISWWLRTATRSLTSEHEADYFKIWDRLIEQAVAIEAGDIKDPVQRAINTPTGILTESLMDRIWARKPEPLEGFAYEIKGRLTDITNGRDKSYVFCRILLASRLHFMFAIDPEWTKLNLLKYFDWKNEDAPLIWQGYLWTPRINPNLFSEIKEYLLIALQKKSLLGQHWEHLFQLFTDVCIEYPEGFTKDEMKRSLKEMDSESRAEIADTIWRRMKAAGKDGSTFWEKRVAPWLEDTWPKDKKYCSPEISKGLALAAIASGTMFEGAVNLIKKYLVPIDDFSFVISKLKEAKADEVDLVAKYPASSLILLNAIVSESSGPSWIPQEFREILNTIKTADSELLKEPTYKQLDEYLTKNEK